MSVFLCAYCSPSAKNSGDHFTCLPIKVAAIVFAVLCFICQLSLAGIWFANDLEIAGIVPIAIVLLIHFILIFGFHLSRTGIIRFYAAYLAILSLALLAIFGWFVSLLFNPVSAPWCCYILHDKDGKPIDNPEIYDEAKKTAAIYLCILAPILIGHVLSAYVVFQLSKHLRRRQRKHAVVTYTSSQDDRPETQAITQSTIDMPLSELSAPPVYVIHTPQAAQFPLPSPTTLLVAETAFDEAVMLPSTSSEPYQPPPSVPPPPYPGVPRAQTDEASSTKKKKEPKW